MSDRDSSRRVPQRRHGTHVPNLRPTFSDDHPPCQQCRCTRPRKRLRIDTVRIIKRVRHSLDGCESISGPNNVEFVGLQLGHCVSRVSRQYHLAQTERPFRRDRLT